MSVGDVAIVVVELPTVIRYRPQPRMDVQKRLTSDLVPEFT